jgi:hypothetical protein
MVVGDWNNPQSPNYIHWTPATPTPATAFQMLQVIALLEKIDKQLNAIDCKLKKPEKSAYKRRLRKRAQNVK